jgi:hypothetical protein
MTENVIEIVAESLEEARKQLNAQIPKGMCVLNEKVLADGVVKIIPAVAETTADAFAKAEKEVPAEATIIDRVEVAIPEHKAIKVDGFDDKGGKANADQAARREFGPNAIVKNLTMVQTGSKGFLGMGVKPNWYQAEVLLQASVQVLHKTPARIRAEIGRKVHKLGLADPSHEARAQIDEAARHADQTVKITAYSDGTILETNSIDGMRLVSLVDAALEQAPDDLDLLLAKSGALCCGMQFKTAEEVLDEVLAKDSHHFEARQRKDNWEKWRDLFQYPSWSTNNKSLHQAMAAHFQQQHSIQIVRDGLQVGIAVIRPYSSQNFPRGLSASMSSKWVPLWSDTPFGGIVAHYVIVNDNPSDPYKGEGFLPTSVPNEMAPASGYWLLRRMCKINSCFIIFTDGQSVVYNSRYVFPDSLKTNLNNITEKMIRAAAAPNNQAFQQACQWHMNNFDLKYVN